MKTSRNIRQYPLPVLAIVLLSSGLNPLSAQQEKPGALIPATPRLTGAVSGAGTANVHPKWIDSAGTLGNSSIFDDGVNIGVGTVTPGATFDFQRAATGDILHRLWNTGAGGTKLRYVAATGATSQLQLTDGTEWLMSIAGNNAIGMQFRVTPSGGGTSEAVLNNSARLTILRNGNVGIGTTNPQFLLEVNGAIKGTVVTATYGQDVAEWVPATAKMTPGTVVILNRGKNNEVMPSDQPYDTKVAGVVASQPGLILGESAASKAMIATTGRVRIHVDATRHPVAIGDLLVTSATPGMAMVSEPVDLGAVKLHRPGTLIGKALEPLASGQGDILVLLSLQ